MLLFLIPRDSNQPVIFIMACDTQQVRVKERRELNLRRDMSDELASNDDFLTQDSTRYRDSVFMLIFLIFENIYMALHLSLS